MAKIRGGGHSGSLRQTWPVAFLGAGKEKKKRREKKGGLGDSRTATWMSYHIRLPNDNARYNPLGPCETGGSLSCAVAKPW